MLKTDTRNPKVVCGWKGCHNVYTNIEGMNVHVQADHMLYRVLLQTEFQGRTHLHGYDNEESAKQTVPQEIPQSGAVSPAIPVTPITPVAPVAPIIQAPVIPVRQPEVPQQVVITDRNEGLQLTVGAVQSDIQLEPVKQVSYPPVPEELHRSGPLTLAEIVTPITQNVQIQEEEIPEEEEEQMEVVDEELPPQLSIASNGSGSPAVRTPNHHPRVDYSPAPPSSKRKGRIHSKYWVYTDHLTYRCNVVHCQAEFGNPDAARHHYHSTHSLGDATDIPQGPSRKRGRSGGNKGGHKIVCIHADCPRYFYSQDALNRHLENLHGEEQVNDNLEIEEYQQGDVEQQQYEKEDDVPEMKELPYYG